MPEHRVVLHEPEIAGREALFSWDVTPETELYRRHDFRLSFPPAVDLTAVPRALWWRIMLICLHTHWALLRPCRVELPVGLPAGEREFWLRLIDNAAVQLEAYGSVPRPGRSVELADDGPSLPPVRVRAIDQRAVVAFSGGKDSLVLTGLLAELTTRPVLVTITSPVPWARDHVGMALDHARKEISQRLGLDVVEVQSDFRTAWDVDFSARDGCRLGVHELSDLPLYHGVLMAVAAACAIGRIFLASEADLQYNAERDGTVILHPDFLSCAVTQAALDALLSTFGLRQGSLTYPLHMPQVHALLLRRYRELADLQYCCWQAPPGAQACSACEKCFQIALVTLSEGESPRVVGIDPVAVLCAFADWHIDAPQTHRGPRLHAFRSSRHHVLRCLQAVSVETVASLLKRDVSTADDPRLGEALAIYARLRADALQRTVPPAPGYIAGFLDLVQPDLRGRLRTILDQHFSPADDEFDETVRRSRALSAWIAEPLSALRPAATPEGKASHAPNERSDAGRTR